MNIKMSYMPNNNKGVIDLMKKSYILMILVLLISSMVLVGCTTDSPPVETPPVEEGPVVGEDPVDSEDPVDGEELVLTTEELAKYDGKNGNPAYIAVDGVIYDVTDVSFWAEGEHNGFAAGKDLTEEIKNKSPHGTSKLDGVPIVGKLSD